LILLENTRTFYNLSNFEEKFNETIDVLGKSIRSIECGITTRLSLTAIYEIHVM